MSAIKNKVFELREDYGHKITRNAQNVVFSLFRTSIMLGICFVILSPLFGVVSNTFKSQSDVYNPLVYLIPETFTLDNVRNAFQTMNYISTLTTTLGYTLGITLIQVFIMGIVGYGFARFRIPGQGVLFALVILTIVLPIQTYMVPMFMQFRYFNFFGAEINLINTYVPIVLLTATGMGLRSGLYIYIFRQFFRGLPKEIEEAAFIDGAGAFKTYFMVMLPNAKPAIVTVIMFSFVWQYNDTFYAALFMSNMDFLATRLTSLSFAYIAGGGSRDPGFVQLVVNAGIVLMVFPILAMYSGLQRFFIEGVERSGIVG